MKSIGKMLRAPFEKRQHKAIMKKEMKKGKIAIYDDDIIELLENQPMFYFQTAVDFMLLKDILGQPAQHIATNVMAVALEGHVKKMHLIEADLNPTYPDLGETEAGLSNENRSYLEVVFLDDEEDPEDSGDVLIGVEQFLEEMKTEQWYVIDTSLGLVFEKGLYMKLEDPEIKRSISGDPLQEIIADTRELIEPGPDYKPRNSLAIMWGLGRMFKAYPRHRYRDLMFNRLLKLQEKMVQRAAMS